ncbi:unnamed protein product, partial [Didymodactylos carnosus]
NDEQRSARLTSIKHHAHEVRSLQNREERDARLTSMKQHAQETRTQQSQEIQEAQLLQTSECRRKRNLKKKNNKSLVAWPQRISDEIKKKCLQNFVEQVSMSKISESTCCICHIRSPTCKMKQTTVSKIPNISLLKSHEKLYEIIQRTISPVSYIATHDDTNANAGRDVSERVGNDRDSTNVYYEDALLYRTGLHVNDRLQDSSK